MAIISFENFVQIEGTPVYLQIIQFVKRGIAYGIIADGDELPSRRMLSAMLSLNPNTIQKAFSILEEEGFIVSRTGAKSCICAAPALVAAVRGQLVEAEIKGAVRAMKAMQLTLEEAMGLIGELYEKEE